MSENTQDGTAAIKLKLPNLQYKGNSVYYSITRNGSRNYHWLGKPDQAPEALLEKYQYWKERYEVRKDMFAALAAEWLDHKWREVNDNLLSPTTYREYAKHLAPKARLARTFGAKPLSQLSTPEIQTFVDTGARYQSNRELATFRAMLGFGVNRGMVMANPARGVTKNREAPRDRYVTDAEFRAVYKVQPKPIQTLMSICYLTGLRIGDVLALRFRDCSSDYLHASEGKTGKRVRFTWSNQLREIVESAKSMDSEFIVSLNGRQLQPAYATKTFRLNFPGGVLPWVLKDLRAKSATDRESPEEASFALGHSGQSLTDRHYLRNQKGRIADPVETALEL